MTNDLKQKLERLRDELADDGKWLGGSHGRALNSAWLKGFNAALEILWPCVAGLDRWADAWGSQDTSDAKPARKEMLYALAELQERLK